MFKNVAVHALFTWSAAENMLQRVTYDAFDSVIDRNKPETNVCVQRSHN